MDGGGGEDMCEYVFNPIMRNIQAMQRLINMMRNTQQDSSCNDFECFTPNNPNSNPLINPSQNDSFFSTTTFLIMGWMFFVFLLYVLRPNSFRNKVSDKKDRVRNQSSGLNRRGFRDNNDDDDGSPIS
jgi:hypothetical protein